MRHPYDSCKDYIHQAVAGLYSGTRWWTGGVSDLSHVITREADQERPSIVHHCLTLALVLGNVADESLRSISPTSADDAVHLAESLDFEQELSILGQTEAQYSHRMQACWTTMQACHACIHEDTGHRKLHRPW